MDTNSTEANKRLLRRLIDEAFNKRNLSVLEEVLHPDFVNHQEIFPLQNKKGPDVFRELYETLFRIFPDVRADYHNVVAEGDFVVAYDTILGTNDGEVMGKPPTGKKVAFDVFHLYRVQDGKIIERWGLTDDLSLMRQLGFINNGQ